MLCRSFLWKALALGGLLASLLLPGAAQAEGAFALSTADGLVLHLDPADPTRQWITLDGKPLASERSPAGFSALDVAAVESLAGVRVDGLVPFAGTLSREGGRVVQRAELPELGLALEAAYEATADYIQVRGTVYDTTGSDRAIVLAYSLPFAALGGTWWEDVRNFQTVEPGRVYRGNRVPFMNFSRLMIRHNQYPFSTLATDEVALAYAVRLDEPTIFRIEYDPDAARYYITFDFGLSPAAVKFPSRASFSFIIYQVDSEWGFRDAARRYYSIYPQFFERRAEKVGNLAFGIHHIAGWPDPAKLSDFHFAYDMVFPQFLERVPIQRVVRANDRLGVETLVYGISGIAHSLRMEKGEFYTYFSPGQRRVLDPGDVEECSMIYQEHLARTEEWIARLPEERRLEARLQNKLLSAHGSEIQNCRCGFYAGDGNAVLTPEDVSYFTGVLVYVNHDPDLPDGTPEHPYLNYAHMRLYCRSDYGLKLDGRPIGLLPYLDELDARGVPVAGAVADYLFAFGEFPVRGKDFLYDYSREHFAYADVPLTFDPRTRRPVIYTAFSFWEFLKLTSEELHAREKLFAANDFGAMSGYFAPLLDLLTTEVAKPTVYEALPDRLANCERFYAYHKPFANLYNRYGTSYREMGREEVEYWIELNMFYGLYPGFYTSNYGPVTDRRIDSYWAIPELNERDRDLWARYMPIIMALDRAGWEPVTYARTDDQDIWVERFGTDPEEGIYFTVRNARDEEATFTLTVDVEPLGMDPAGPFSLVELVSGSRPPYTVAEGTIRIAGAMAPGETQVFKLTTPAGGP